MKHKTRAFCKGVENACRIAREIPDAYPVSGPEHDFTHELIKTRDSFFEDDGNGISERNRATERRIQQRLRRRR